MSSPEANYDLFLRVIPNAATTNCCEVLSEGLGLDVLLAFRVLNLLEESVACGTLPLILVVNTKPSLVASDRVLADMLCHCVGLANASPSRWPHLSVALINALPVSAFDDSVAATSRSDVYRRGGCLATTSRYLAGDILHRRLCCKLVSGTFLLVPAGGSLSAAEVDHLYFVYELMRSHGSRSPTVLLSDSPQDFEKHSLLAVSNVSELRLYPRFRREIFQYFTDKKLVVAEVDIPFDETLFEVLRHLGAICGQVVEEIRSLASDDSAQPHPLPEGRKRHRIAEDDDPAHVAGAHIALATHFVKSVTVDRILYPSDVESLRILAETAIPELQRLRELVLSCVDIARLYYHAALLSPVELLNSVTKRLECSDSPTGVGIAGLSPNLPHWALSNRFASFMGSVTKLAALGSNRRLEVLTALLRQFAESSTQGNFAIVMPNNRLCRECCCRIRTSLDDYQRREIVVQATPADSGEDRIEELIFSVENPSIAYEVVAETSEAGSRRDVVLLDAEHEFLSKHAAVIEAVIIDGHSLDIITFPSAAALRFTLIPEQLFAWKTLKALRGPLTGLIAYDYNLILLRQLELFSAMMHPTPSLTLFRDDTLLQHSNLLLGQKFNKDLSKLLVERRMEREQAAFVGLVREKSRLCATVEVDRFQRLVASNELAPVLKARLQGQGAIVTQQPVVLFDEREFRSLLPHSLFRQGFHVIPLTLITADYIISPNLGIERKAVNDLVQSLRNGRMISQLQAMERRFKQCVLLIEFSGNAEFQLRCHDAAGVRAALVKVLSLCRNTAVCWTRSPAHSAALFLRLKGSVAKENADPLDPSWTSVQQNHASETLNLALRVLLRFPGVNRFNVTVLIRRVGSLSGLRSINRQELVHLLGDVNGEKLFGFLRNSLFS